MASPDDDEMTTTTLRNRGSKKANPFEKKEPKGKRAATPTPPEPKSAKKKGITPDQFKRSFEKHEQSDDDYEKDRRRAAQLHITVAKYEMTPEDRRKDIRGSIKGAIKQLKNK